MRRRLLGAAGVLLGTVLALEGALQLAALVVPNMLSRAKPASAGGYRILCVGDSHTYGSGAAALESYPRLLEAELARRHPGQAFEVMNLGVPGMNSSQVANRVEAWIDELSPELVIVWVGLNNPWNATESPDRSRLHRLLLRSRLYRLAAVAWAKRPPPALTREQRQADRSGTREPLVRREVALAWPEALRTLDRDFARVVAVARNRWLPVILINYPYSFHPELRDAIRENGERLAVPVVDTALDARRAEEDGAFPIFVWGAGYHPTGILNRYIAASLADAAEQAMGLDPGPDGDDPESPHSGEKIPSSTRHPPEAETFINPVQSAQTLRLAPNPCLWWSSSLATRYRGSIVHGRGGSGPGVPSLETIPAPQTIPPRALSFEPSLRGSRGGSGGSAAPDGSGARARLLRRGAVLLCAKRGSVAQPAGPSIGQLPAGCPRRLAVPGVFSLRPVAPRG